MQNTFVASRVELKGWVAWRNILGTKITLSEAKQLISDARMKLDDLNKFDWERTDLGKGNFDIKMMTLLWLDEKVAPCERERVQLDLQQALASVPIKMKEADVRATFELDLEKRSWDKAQAIFICAMREHANLPRYTFDIRWVNTGVRVSVSMTSPECDAAFCVHAAQRP